LSVIKVERVLGISTVKDLIIHRRPTNCRDREMVVVLSYLKLSVPYTLRGLQHGEDFFHPSIGIYTRMRWVLVLDQSR
jgi:hypothetical protein